MSAVFPRSMSLFSRVHCIPGSLSPGLYVFATVMQLLLHFVLQFCCNFVCNFFVQLSPTFWQLLLQQKVANTLQKVGGFVCKKVAFFFCNFVCQKVGGGGKLHKTKSCNKVAKSCTKSCIKVANLGAMNRGHNERVAMNPGPNDM